MVSNITFSPSVAARSIVHTAIHINTKTALVPLDPSPGVTKDPSKTFYFCDVLNCIFKRTLMNTSAYYKEEEHVNHQRYKNKKALIMEFVQEGLRFRAPVSRWCRLLH